MIKTFYIDVSTHSRLKAAGTAKISNWKDINVSTHSRLKAAGFPNILACDELPGFNTQPPEGGWAAIWICLLTTSRFNTQPPEGGWCFIFNPLIAGFVFQHTAA